MTRHRVSADVIMLVFLLCGAMALTRLTVRFFPEFEINVIVTTVTLVGATPTEIEETVIVPLENGLRNVPDFRKISSYSSENYGSVVMEFDDSVDLEKALEDVKAEAERVNFPDDAEAPSTSTAEFQLQVANVAIVGSHPAELRDLVRRLENDINARGIGKIEVTGVPQEEILVLVDQTKLVDLDLSLAQVGRTVGDQNNNASVGSVTGLGNERKVRSDSKTSDFSALYSLPVAADADGGVVYLRDIATIVRRPVKDQVTMLYNGEPAAQLNIQNSGNANILDVAEQLNAWIAEQRETLPDSVRLVSYDEEWRNVESRLNLLVDNGLVGMLIVIAVLYLFLSSQVALWVAVGIPVAMFGTLFVFYLTGGSINMISMFALIMAVGIIVDDAIVVGENAQHRLSKGEPPMRAVISAARTMFTPVFASSFTTIAAFLPLFLITGPIGGIIFDIPLIIVCLLIAALIECFLVLPGHLYRSFAKRALAQPGIIRRRLDAGFEHFREKIFRPVSRFAVRHAIATVTACVMIMYLSFSLLMNGFVGYRFFPGAEGNNLTGAVSFSSGTPRAVTEEYVRYMVDALHATDRELRPDDDSSLLAHVIVMQGQSGAEFDPSKDHHAVLGIELVEADTRDVTVDQFSEGWLGRLERVPGIISLDVRGNQAGPPGRDIEIRLAAEEVADIKPAAQELIRSLANIPGVTSVNDDTPYGKEELIFELTPLGRSLNVDVRDVADQLKHALDGFEVQTFTEGVDETDLRVKLADFDTTNVFDTLYLRLPSGERAPLRDIVTWQTRQGFDTILHQFGRPSIVVSADLDPEAKTTVGDVLAEVERTVLADLYRTRGITYSFQGKTADEQQTAQEMMTGLVLALALIYIILTWVFNSWSVPIVVMMTMPMGVIGTILGHWIMGQSMSILSFFGMFTLMGILVNNSIVLVSCFKSLGVENRVAEEYNAAIVEASCLRLRAVLLTSLTTIGGLLPLLFETSLQAKFLQPMAISICFGLAFAAVLILLFTPACLALHGAAGRGYRSLAARVERHTIRGGRHRLTG